MKQLTRKFIRFLYTRPVSKSVSFRVRKYFRTFFEGVYNDTYDGIGWLIKPQTNVTLKDLALVNVKVYRYKGVLTLHLTTSRPGICIGKGGNLIDGYRDYISKQMNEKVSIQITEAKSLFNY